MRLCISHLLLYICASNKKLARAWDKGWVMVLMEDPLRVKGYRTGARY